MTDVQASESSTGYMRFIILSGARTGSNLLASSLNSSSEITCFRELFNFTEKRFIGFNVDGYDRYNAADRELRDSDYAEFLRQRIFCTHPAGTRAVGFKMPYDHFWGYEGLLEWLEADDKLGVVHLKRGSHLRTLVSLRIALATGAWVDDRRPLADGELVPGRKLSALTLTPDECTEFFKKFEWDAKYYGERFAHHPTHSIFYEDITGNWEATLASLQEFLGVDPQPLEAGTRRQNPQPLRELITNFDELHEAFNGTSDAWMFEE